MYDQHHSEGYVFLKTLAAAKNLFTIIIMPTASHTQSVCCTSNEDFCLMNAYSVFIL